MEKQTQVPVSEPEKRILEALRVEFFPVLNKLKDLLTRMQNCRLFFYVFSPSLSDLEKEYFDISAELFVIDKKLTTPDVLFKGLNGENIAMLAYFRWRPMIIQSLSEAMNYTEIIDRNLDRKRQTINNNRTTCLALIAILASILWR